jgi:hypothetical protein
VHTGEALRAAQAKVAQAASHTAEIERDDDSEGAKDGDKKEAEPR